MARHTRTQHEKNIKAFIKTAQTAKSNAFTQSLKLKSASYMYYKYRSTVSPQSIYGRYPSFFFNIFSNTFTDHRGLSPANSCLSSADHSGCTV